MASSVCALNKTMVDDSELLEKTFDSRCPNHATGRVGTGGELVIRLVGAISSADVVEFATDVDGVDDASSSVLSV